MGKRRRLMATAGTMAVAMLMLFVGGNSASAGSAATPEITDPAGDANFVGGQGLVGGLEDQVPDTRPASIDGADLRAVWFETGYTRTILRFPPGDPREGQIKEIFYTPTSVRVNIRTTAPAIPSFGPNLIFRVPVIASPPSGGSCSEWFQAWINGPLSVAPGTVDIAQRADIRPPTTSAACGTGTKVSPSALTSNGDVMTLEFPLAWAASNIPSIRLGSVLKPDTANSGPHVRTAPGSAATAPTIDDMNANHATWSFTIGSDVPTNVDCSVTPDDERCAG